MSTPLTLLAAQLEQAIPARDGVPASYTELVQAAIWQLSTDLPMVRQATINVVAGTAIYTLPDDFLHVIALTVPTSESGVIVGDGKLIAAPAGWDEQYYIAGSEIAFDPTPTYTMARTLRYAAAHVLDASSAYPRLSANGARIALLYAQYLALQEQAAAVAGDGWSYKIGDEAVDKRGQGSGIQTQAAALLASYQNAVKGLKGYGSQYRHSVTFDGAVEV